MAGLLGALLFFLALSSGLFLLHPWLPLPPSLTGIGVVLLLLVYLGRVPVALDKVGRFMLSHLSLLFIPVIVSAGLYLSSIQSVWGVLLFAVVSSTLISLLVTLWIAARLDKKYRGPS